MLDNIFFSCLVISFVGNSVSDISLDYYFGFDDSLRSEKLLRNCNLRGAQETCQAQCGPNHACLLGKCFCVKSPIKKSDSDISLDYYFGLDESLRSEKLRQNCDSRRAQETCQAQCGPNHACLLGKCFCVNVEPPIGKSVGDISLDYYFGRDESLRPEKLLRNCNSRRAQETCQAQCGPNHACLLGKCFCVNVKPPIEKSDDNSDIARAGNSCKKLHSDLRVLEKFLSKVSLDNREDSSSESDSSSEESESKENNHNSMRLDEMALRPSLRHHIAHFCPNLDIARQCIHKCMELGKPAFCGKDHICYCGHRLESGQAGTKTSTERYSPFDDLYEKYFGPRYGRKNITTNVNAAESANKEQITLPEKLNKIIKESPEEEESLSSSNEETTSPVSDTTTDTTTTTDSNESSEEATSNEEHTTESITTESGTEETAYDESSVITA